MDSLPMPGGIDPQARHVEFYVMECLTPGCGMRGPTVPRDSTDASLHTWDVVHGERTGHKRFYKWTLTRQIASVESMPVRRRRPLGKGKDLTQGQ